MAKKKAKIKKVSFKEKSWYEVIAPKIFRNKSIGDIIGLDYNVPTRTIEALLYDFTNDFKDINLKLKFRIVTINTEARKCETIFIGHEYTNDYVRSLIGRGSTRIAIIGNYTTKDNYVYRLTTVCVTIRRARSSQMIIIRKIMRDVLKEFAVSLNHEKFVQGMIFGEFQAQIARIAKTLFPLSSAIIIKSKLVSMPEGGVDEDVRDDNYDIIEVNVKRSRKSEMKRTERINVKKMVSDKSGSSEERQEPEKKKEEAEVLPTTEEDSSKSG